MALLILHFIVGFVRAYHPAHEGREVYISHTRMAKEGPLTVTRPCYGELAGAAMDAVAKGGCVCIILEG